MDDVVSFSEDASMGQKLDKCKFYSSLCNYLYLQMHSGTYVLCVFVHVRAKIGCSLEDGVSATHLDINS